MKQLVYSQAAENDLIETYLYSIENFGEQHADEYEAGIKRRLSQLLSNPKIGIDLADIGINLRKMVYRAHIIYYEIRGETLVIRRILDARQDPMRHL